MPFYNSGIGKILRKQRSNTNRSMRNDESVELAEAKTLIQTQAATIQSLTSDIQTLMQTVDEKSNLIDSINTRVGALEGGGR